MRRDALFRRTLLVADLIAMVTAFVLTVELSRALAGAHLGGIAALPILVVCAKLSGLYDRDEALLRKTTLDEAPKLFQLATLVALVCLAGRAGCSWAGTSTATRRCSCGSRWRPCCRLARRGAAAGAAHLADRALPVHRR